MTSVRFLIKEQLFLPTNKNFKFDASEQLAILKSRSDISEEYYDTLRKLDKDPNNKELQRKRDALSFKLDTHDQVLTNIGTIAGQVLWARRMFLDRELTKAKVLDKMRNDGEGYIPSDVKKKMDDLFDEKDKLSATIDGLEKKLKEANEALEKEKALNESLGKNAISVQGEPRPCAARGASRRPEDRRARHSERAVPDEGGPARRCHPRRGQRCTARGFRRLHAALTCVVGCCYWCCRCWRPVFHPTARQTTPRAQ